MGRYFKKLIIYIIPVVFLLSLASNTAYARTFKSPIKKTVTVKTTVIFENGKKTTTTKQIETEIPNKENNQKQGQKSAPKNKVQKAAFPQFEMPQKGDEIVVIRTNMGVIKIRLLADYAPKTVEAFKNQISSGLFDGYIFSRVINGSMIQSGPRNQNEGIAVNTISEEFNPEIRNFRGAVTLVGSGQFSIVQAGPRVIDKDPLNFMQNSGDKFPAAVIEKYKKTGGAPFLDYQSAVFGQVFQGMNIVDKIAQSQVDENNKPKKDIKILSIEIQVYK